MHTGAEKETQALWTWQLFYKNGIITLIEKMCHAQIKSKLNARVIKPNQGNSPVLKVAYKTASEFV